MRQIDWSDLKLFLLFIRLGSTRSAGGSLGISHSTVARRLNALNTLAGAPLFSRVGGKLKLTTTGQKIFETAIAVEDKIITLDRRTFGSSQGLVGTLTLSTGDVLSGAPLLSILDDFRKAHPKIDLRLITSASLSNLDRRDADLALRFGESPSDHLVGRKLTQTGRAVYASHAYIDKLKADPDARDAGWISFSPEGASESWKRSTPFANLPTNMWITDMRTQQIACRAGVGLVLLPCVLCDPDPDLVRITEPEFVPRQDLWLLRHAELRDNAKVRALSEHLVNALSQISDLMIGRTATTHPLGQLLSG